jgi:hypothetical protein
MRHKILTRGVLRDQTHFIEVKCYSFFAEITRHHSDEMGREGKI